MPSDFKLMWYRVDKSNPTMEELFEFIDSELAVRNRMRASIKLTSRTKPTHVVSPDTKREQKRHGETVAVFILQKRRASFRCLYQDHQAKKGSVLKR
jgi:hypothetical protein